MRYAVCNELFGDLPFSRACRIAKEEGFEGIEIAPFSIFGDFSDATIGRAMVECRRILQEEGLQFVGFHWLLAKPEGLHLASPDRYVRSRSWEHLRFMLECAAGFGGGKLVLGSPKQRSTPQGMTPIEVKGILLKELSAIADHAVSCNSQLLIEALSPDQTDIVTSLEEAVDIVEKVGKPAIKTMFDFHNARRESLGPAPLIERFYPYIEHIHLNETEGGAPGTGSTDYMPSLRALLRRGYFGWLSMEIFQAPEDPRQVLRTAMRTMQEAEASARMHERSVIQGERK